MPEDIKEKELFKLYRDRIHDRNQTKTRRRRRVENSPQAFGSLLDKYFRKNSNALRKIEESRALTAWADLVGKAAAQVSCAKYIRNHRLIVYVRDPLWMHQLFLLKSQLVREYRRAFPKLDIRDIFYTRSR